MSDLSNVGFTPLLLGRKDTPRADAESWVKQNPLKGRMKETIYLDCCQRILDILDEIGL